MIWLPPIAVAAACEPLDTSARLGACMNAEDEGPAASTLACFWTVWDQLPEACPPAAAADIALVAHTAANFALVRRAELVAAPSTVDPTAPDEAAELERAAQESLENACRTVQDQAVSPLLARILPERLAACDRVGARDRGEIVVDSAVVIDGVPYAAGAKITLPIGMHVLGWNESDPRAGSWLQVDSRLPQRVPSRELIYPVPIVLAPSPPPPSKVRLRMRDDHGYGEPHEIQVAVFGAHQGVSVNPAYRDPGVDPDLYRQASNGVPNVVGGAVTVDISLHGPLYLGLRVEGYRMWDTARDSNLYVCPEVEDDRTGGGACPPGWNLPVDYSHGSFGAALLVELEVLDGLLLSAGLGPRRVDYLGDVEQDGAVAATYLGQEQYLEGATLLVDGSAWTPLFSANLQPARIFSRGAGFPLTHLGVSYTLSTAFAGETQRFDPSNYAAFPVDNLNNTTQFISLIGASHRLGITYSIPLWGHSTSLHGDHKHDALFELRP